MKVKKNSYPSLHGPVKTDELSVETLICRFMKSFKLSLHSALYPTTLYLMLI